MPGHEYIGREFGIRRYREADIPRLYEAARESITEVYRWLPWCHPDYSLEDSRSWVGARGEAWEEGREYNLLIFKVGTGAFVGGVEVNHINQLQLSGNLGYWVRTGCTGRGAATSATRLAARFAFEELCLKRIEIVVAVENSASQRVAQKAGATREGVMRRHLNLHGAPNDAVMYSLVPDDMAAWPR